MKKISIIMPVYNVEEYLRQSVSSLLKQSYEKLEIILIDDGSNDASGKICDCLAAQDKRIVVRHQENAGPGAARNLALDIATGDYVMFCDSDDEYTPDMCLKMVSSMETNQVDFAICECEFFGSSPEGQDLSYFRVPNREIVKSNIDDALLRLNGVIWNKIFRRELIEKYEIRFPNTGIHEDVTFYLEYAMVSKRAHILHEKLYRYRLRQGSVTHSDDFYERRLEANLKAWDHEVDFARRWRLLKTYKRFFTSELIFIYNLERRTISIESRVTLKRQIEDRYLSLGKGRRKILRRGIYLVMAIDLGAFFSWIGFKYYLLLAQLSSGQSLRKRLLKAEYYRRLLGQRRPMSYLQAIKGELFLFSVMAVLGAANVSCEIPLVAIKWLGFWGLVRAGIWYALALFGVALVLGRFSKVILLPFVLLSGLLLPIILFGRYNFGCEITSDLLLIVLAATREEIAMFAERYVTIKSVLLVLGYLLALSAVCYALFKFRLRKWHWSTCLLGLSLLGLFQCFVEPYSQRLGPIFRFRALSFIRSAYESSGLYVDLAGTIKKASDKAVFDIVWAKDAHPIYVMVIGESATRSHLGIYGYVRDTTPNLAKETNIVAFTDVLTASTSTQKSIYYTFTGAEVHEVGFNTRYLALRNLKNAGFSIELYSGQEKTGFYDTIVSYVLSSADKSVYLSDIKKSTVTRSCFDGDLLDNVRLAIASEAEEPKLILYHLKGSHVDAINNYPREDIVFDPESDSVNAYDNSIRYTDKLIGKVIDSLKALHRPAMLIYLSDHGESVGTGKWRDNAVRSTWEVPFVIWYSDEFASAQAGIVERLKAVRDIPLQSDWLTSGLMSILGVKGVAGENDEKNFLSLRFQAPTRRVYEQQ